MFSTVGLEVIQVSQIGYTDWYGNHVLEAYEEY